ncbi:zinc-ribbon domain-containing protein [Allorhodopirellula heiligendammensis]|uniref:Uncharacterized protein n=1 Tax=Allorhodopirellula heiligendammensis TaxID=2714739 RepID=A0A5C6C972_9BACT|nr:zinc-ribbon domain-containing protein [Allorhodopirellula heiligendammensis]TWU19904.1 hypothetical protein Poly21_20830 [Allorhodopirellula heiligendammensis]
MPIAVKCGCGKQLNVRDELAGKAIKCPGCGNAVKVVAGGAPAKPRAAAAARPAAPSPRPAPTPARSELDDLFAEEGMDRDMGAICPACRKELPPGAVLCTKCGYNLQTGERFDGHKVAGVDIDKGTMALDKAERDMDEAKRLQQEMIGKSGMPAWMLALILFILASAMGIAVLAVNASRREEAVAFKPMQMFMNLGGSAFLLVALGAALSLITVAFRSDTKQGLLSLTILYLFVFPFKHGKGTWKILAVAVLSGGIAGAFFYGASRM